MTFDLLLVGGEVIDGTGAAARRADVGVTLGRITAVGELGPAHAAVTIDARGLTIAPGFIDTHAHTDVLYLLGGDADDLKAANVRQGVTTEVTGNCGFSPFPATSVALDTYEPYRALFPRERARYFRTLAEYRTVLGQVGLPVNIAPLVGHGRIRAAVLAGENRPATKAERKQIARMVDEAVGDGAFGMSSGLAYVPGQAAETGELIDALAGVHRHGLPYVTHLRDEGDHALAAIGEALLIGGQAQVGVHISHHKIAGRGNWGLSTRTLALIEAARARGELVTVDVYPYTAGSTLTADLLPPWVLSGGGTQMRERLRDAHAVERMSRDLTEGLPGWQNLVGLCGWSAIRLAGAPDGADGSVSALAATAGLAEPQLLASLLIEDPTSIAIIDMMDEAEVETIRAQPYAMTGSDGIPAPGPAHPRIAGTFARVLARTRSGPSVLADTIRKMTSLPAQRFRIPDRGKVTAGLVADLVVFDPATVADRATYASSLRPPTGIRHVLVAGEPVIFDGDLTGRQPGTVLAPR